MNSTLVVVLASWLTVSVCEGANLFASDWHKNRGAAPGEWMNKHVMADDRLKVDHDPAGGMPMAILRVEVRPGDKVNGMSGERAEVYAMRTNRGQHLSVAPKSGHEYYGLSIKLDSAWTPPQANAAGYLWGTFFQLHGPDSLGGSPAFALMATTDFHVEVCAGDLLDGGKRSKKRPPEIIAFADGGLNAGRWSQFLIDVVWAPDQTGSLAIYRRNQGSRDWQKMIERTATPTLQYAFGQPVEEHYWKAGYYRSECQVRSLLWLGPLVRGTNREEVEKEAFGRR